MQSGITGFLIRKYSVKREKAEEVEGKPIVHPRMFGMRLSVYIKFLSGL